MKNQDDILNLIVGNLSKEQRKEVISLLKEDSEETSFYRKAKITWALMSSTQKMSDYRIENSYRNLQARISAHNRLCLLKSHRCIRYAAVIIMLLGISTLMYFSGEQNYRNLSKEIYYTSVIADNGQISKVVLPDSSVVWLNSGTTLTYDNNFSLTNRNLSLNGQAYLDVRKNKDLPLIVSSNNLQVKVLGTRFDVKAYPDDMEMQVTLESGNIELLNLNDKAFKYRLIPGQMARINSISNKVKIKTIETRTYSNWKDGELIFSDTPMCEVLKMLERKFDVVFEIDNQNVYRSVFNANFKKESLKEILDYIQFTCHLNYRIQKEDSKTMIILN